MLPSTKTKKAEQMPAPLDPSSTNHSAAALRDPKNHDADRAPARRCAAAGASRAACRRRRSRARGGKSEGRIRFSRRAVYRLSNDPSRDGGVLSRGGWVAGDLETMTGRARWLAIETRAARRLSVDYRARQRCAFPARSRMRLPPCATSPAASPNSAPTGTALASAGDSAAHLAAASAIACPRRRHKARRALLVYPHRRVRQLPDARRTRGSSRGRENAEGYFLSRAVMEWFARALSRGQG